MKTIKINGVDLRVTWETTDAMVKQVHRFGLDVIGQSDGTFSVRQSDHLTLIQRALSALGYVVGDHQKDVEQFSRWVDHLALCPRSEEALALWTESMLARLGSAEPPMTNETVDEASAAALRVVAQRMRLFPPAPDTGWHVPEPWSELQEWRSAAKANGIASPKELAESANINFGQFVDRKVSREWQSATDCLTPAQAKSKIDGLLEQAEQRERAWCAAKRAIVPLPKPEKVEAGQRWAMVGEVRTAGSGGVYFTNGLMGAIHGATNEGAVLREPGAIYLGKNESNAHDFV